MAKIQLFYQHNTLFIIFMSNNTIKHILLRCIYYIYKTTTWWCNNKLTI